VPFRAKRPGLRQPSGALDRLRLELFHRLDATARIFFNGQFCFDTSLDSAYVQPVRIASRSRSRRPKVNLQSQLFTLSNAKTYLGRLVEKAGRGETVYIVRGHRRFVLQAVPEIEPIPVRPAGYFASACSSAEIREENRLAKASVIRAPKDLE
jgi:hypothetical protein